MCEKPNYRACPVCKGEQFQELFYLQEESFVKCRTCNLVQINPLPTDEKIIDTYSEQYSQIYIKKAHKKLKRAERNVKRIKKLTPNGNRWLDLGCSAGFMVKAINQYGYEGYGLDIDGKAIEYGRDTLNLRNLICSSSNTLPYKDNFFDVISAYDVIEHSINLENFIREICRILKPGGIFDIITPDVGHWSVPSNLRKWKEIKPSEHLYYFCYKNLDRLLQNFEMKIIRKRFTFKSSLKVTAQLTSY